MDLEQRDAGQPRELLPVDESCRQLTQYLRDILQDPQQARLDIEQLDQACRELGEAMGELQALAQDLTYYSTQLSKGNLTLDFPKSGSSLYSGLKNLHANLKHITWQAGQVSKGDYSQRVSFLGEFSDAFNTMTEQLKVREAQLKAEAQRAERRAGIIDGYTGMLADLLSQREEWMLVVDTSTRKIVHCNKCPVDGVSCGAFCESCSQRLPIRPKLLEWNGSEHYKVWEEESGGACYRATSFPVEWKGQHACVHIVADITNEKMNARHLNNQEYHDVDTGVRNRLFLDEFMGRVLQEKVDFTLCYLDLEGVEEINATRGRKAGDTYIQNFVDAVRKHFRNSDTFARVKDDKFCLVLSGSVKHLIERKMSEIAAAFQRDEEKIFKHRCSFNFGIVEVNGETNTMTLYELLDRAEVPIRISKRQRRKMEMDFDFF